MSTLYQRTPTGATGANEVDVPGVDPDILVMFTRGYRVHMRIDGKPGVTSPLPWCFTLVPADAPSWWLSPAAVGDVFHIHLGRASLDPELTAPLRVLASCDDDVVKVMARWILDEARRGGEPPGLLWDTMALALRIRQQRLAAHPRAAPARPTGGLAPWQLKRLTEFLQDHMPEDVSLASLGMLVQLSPAHLCRAFKASTSLPPYQWLIVRRMEQARELLATTALPVTDVAAAVGHHNPGHFATAFRKVTGLTPFDYRRQAAG